MGRCKIAIQFLENKTTRISTYRKRSTGLLKKADELHVLCGATVYLRIKPNEGGPSKEYDSKRRDVYVQSCVKKQNPTPKKQQQGAAKVHEEEEEEDDDDEDEWEEDEEVSSNASNNSQGHKVTSSSSNSKMKVMKTSPKKATNSTTRKVTATSSNKVFTANQMFTSNPNVKKEPQSFAEKIFEELQAVDMSTMPSHPGVFPNLTADFPSYQQHCMLPIGYSQPFSNLMDSVPSYPQSFPPQQVLLQPKQEPVCNDDFVFNQVVPKIGEYHNDFLFDTDLFHFDDSAAKPMTCEHEADGTFFTNMFSSVDQMGNTWLQTPV